MTRIRILPAVAAAGLATLLFSLPAPAADGPTLLKDTLKITLYSRDHFTDAKGSDLADRPSWLPQVAFKVAGPVPSGSRIEAEFSLPGKPKWVKFDFDTPELPEGDVWELKCEYRDFSSKDNVNVTGNVGIRIGIRNELLETQSTLFTGTFKVARGKNPDSPREEFYVDQDWRLPIGYVYMNRYASGSAAAPILHLDFWLRGYPGCVAAHLFHEGKEIANHRVYEGIDGNWNPAKLDWWPLTAYFRGVYVKPAPEGWAEDPNYVMTEHPGEYEIKILTAGKLARSVKFTVDDKGLVDAGIAEKNALGSRKVIVPIRVLGESGPWNRLAWKTEAFYGNPLAGFAAAE